MSKSSKVLLWAVLGVVLILILSIVLFNSLTGPTEVTFTELVNKVAAGDIESVTIDGYVYTAVDEDTGERFQAAGPRSGDPMQDSFDNAVQTAAGKGKTVNISFTDPNAGSYLSYLIPLVGIILVCVVFWLIIRQTQGGSSKAMSFAKTKARVNANIKVRFSDVAGAEEEKQELAEVVEFLKSPRKFSDLGARIPKGILLVGPPGTGKTLFAKAVAGEANVPFFSISGSDFVEMFVGVGASRVRDLFDQAKHNMPCIVFIDEIDAVGRQRGTGLGGGHDEREQTLNQLLVQMDGFEKNDGIIVMAATNRADILDPALLRPGRFDRQIYVQVPDVRGREEIFKVHARNKPLAPDIDFKTLARLTSGFTGADIENLLNEAAILCARDNRKVITMGDINEGINKVIAGPQKKSRVVSERDKRITAYHESGHAIVAKLLKNCDEVNEVSIIPRGQAAGYTITRPVNDDNHVTRGKLMDEIAMMLAGRVAEEIVIEDITTGASNDIQRASAIARKMVTEWGMSPLGTIYLGNPEHEVFLGRDFNQQAMSPETAAKVDAEMKSILDECYDTARNILSEHRDLLDNMVKVLFAKETIFQNEVDMLFEGKTPEEIIKLSNEKSMEKMKAAEASKTEEKTDDKKAEVGADDKTAADEIKKLHEKLKEKIEKIENSAPAEQTETDTSEKPEDNKTDEKPDENK